MTDPLIELAREIAATALDNDGSEFLKPIVPEVRAGFYDELSDVQSALSALRTQQAMIAEWMRGLYENSSLFEQVEEIADAIEQSEYLKGRG